MTGDSRLSPATRGTTIPETRITHDITPLSANLVQIVTPQGLPVKCHRATVDAALRWIMRDDNATGTAILWGWSVCESECDALLAAMGGASRP